MWKKYDFSYGKIEIGIHYKMRCTVYHIHHSTFTYRGSTWLNRRYGITGLLYWTTIQWASDKRNPWDDPAFRGSFNGGGQLIYPGEEAGINGPISTIRLKVLRDAMEDYEYFNILDQNGKMELVNQMVKEVVPDWGSWKQNPQIYLDLRRKMGEVISAAK